MKNFKHLFGGSGEGVRGLESLSGGEGERVEFGERDAGFWGRRIKMRYIELYRMAFLN